MKNRRQGIIRRQPRHVQKRGRRASFEQLEARQLLAVLYVDGQNGTDLQSSASSTFASLATPLKTISRAALFAQAGDTVSIRGGTYREQVTVSNTGTAEAPIRFEAYNGEDVVISGGNLITGWSQAPEIGPDVWKRSAPADANGRRDANTLFVNGEMKLEASQFADEDRLDTDSWGRIGQFPSFGNTLQSIDLVGFGDDYWNGAVMTMMTRDYAFANRTITDYDSATGTVTFSQNVDAILQRQTNIFRIHSTTKALDKPGEWYSNGTTLYYQAEAGQNPNALQVEWKSRGFGFNIQNKQYIEIDGIHFRGVVIDTLDSDGSVFSNNEFYAYGRGSFGTFVVEGDNLTIRDNEFSFSWPTALDFGTTNRTDVVNNYFHDFALNPIATGLSARFATEVLISHNTFRKFGRNIFDGYPVRSEIAYNVFEDAGKTSWDSGIFDADGGNGNNSFSIVHHNVFRDSAPRGIIMAFYGGNANLVVHHNIIHDWPLQLQGTERSATSATATEFRYFYHNTFIGTPPDGVPRDGYKPPQARIEHNYNNNIQLDMDRIDALGSDVRGSYNYSPADFVDFNGRDFRLAAGSGAIDTGVLLPGINDDYLGDAPDAGAIEFGESMWQVGHDFVNKPNPVYDWQLPAGVNLYANGLFSQGADDWEIVSGNPDSQDRNSWNLGGVYSFTGSIRTESVEFLPGESIRREFTGLKPNTLYTLGTAARIGEAVTQGGDYDASSGAVTRGSYRGNFYASGLLDDLNSWVSYDIDFGELGQYSRLELLAARVDPDQSAEDGTVEVWLGGVNGQLLGTLEFDDLYGGYNLVQPLSSLELPPLEGVQTLTLRLTGATAPNVAVAEIQLFQDDLAESDKLTVSVQPLGLTPVTRQIGWSEWQFGYETMEFTTGADGSATVSFVNNGRINAYLDRLFLLEGEVRQGTNIAYLVAAGTQSSVAGANTPEKAVDGDTSTFAETLDQPNSWWQTDLGDMLSIGEIVLTNRDDSRSGELSNFTVSVWTDDPDAGGSKLWEQSFYSTGSVAQGDSLRISGNTIGADGVTHLASAFGRVVRVQLNGLNNAGNGHLSLAEVEIRASVDAPPTRNIAQGKPTQQTRQYFGRAGKSEHAVNGVVDTYEEYSAAITALPEEGGAAWWQVDLEQARDIDQIVVVNYDSDRIGAFRVSVWDADPRFGGQEVWGKDYAYSNSAPYVSTNSIGYGGSLRIDGTTLGSNGTPLSDAEGGRFVRVELVGNLAGPHNLLILSEVQVWAAVPAPALTLTVDPSTGQAVLSNQSDDAIQLDGYTIHDPAGSLLVDGWFSFEDQQFDGGEWVEANITSARVSELINGEQLTTLVQGASVYLGELFDPQLLSTVEFQHFSSETLDTTAGEVVFASLGLPTIPGDYNGDQIVNLADYGLWRDHLGTTASAFAGADGNGNGVVDRSDYLLWKKNFGRSAPAQPAALSTASSLTLEAEPSSTPQEPAPAAISAPYLSPAIEADRQTAAATVSSDDSSDLKASPEDELLLMAFAADEVSHDFGSTLNEPTATTETEVDIETLDFAYFDLQKDRLADSAGRVVEGLQL